MHSELGKLRHGAGKPPLGQWPGGKLGELPAPFRRRGLLGIADFNPSLSKFGMGG